MAEEFLPRLRPGVPIANKDFTASPQMVLEWQKLVTMLEGVPAIAAGLQGEIDAANAAVAASASESSLVASFPTNPTTPPLIEAASTGLVTISDHDRQYGNTALNPTVSVDGNSIATGGSTGDVIRPYYLDPTREGGAVSYLFTINDSTAPVQGDDTHAIGAVTIPAAGTQAGNGVRPPGVVDP